MNLLKASALVLLLAGCAREQMSDCFKGAGAVMEDRRDVAGFTRIEMNDEVDVRITQDTSLSMPEVTVMAGRNVVPNVKAEVESGTIRISNTMRCNWVRRLDERPLVNIRLPRLDGILNQGQGDLSSTNTIHGAEIRIEQWDGHGTIALHLDVGHCHVELHTGVGDVMLSGHAHSAYYYTATLSRVDAVELEASTVQVNCTGIPDLKCRATQTLNAELSSLGNVYYAGDPPVVQATVTGQGQLLPL